MFQKIIFVLCIFFFFLKGLCLYYEDNIDSAFQHFQQVLRLAPDHAKGLNIYKTAKALKKKKDEGNEAYKLHKFNVSTVSFKWNCNPVSVGTDRLLLYDGIKKFFYNSIFI